VPVPDSGITVGEVGALLVMEMLPLALPAAAGANTALNDTLAPAASVCAVSPCTLKPVPVTVTCEMVKLAVPVFFRLIGCELLVPTVTLPKFTVVGVTEISGCVAVPDSEITVGEVGALLVMEMLPLALPAAVGANTALNDTLAPAATVCAVSPCTLKPAPVTVTCEMVKLAVPVFFRLIGCELLVPTTTLPKFTGEEGVTEICGASVPVPLREMFSGELEALLITVSVPLTAPADWGAN